MLPPRMFLLMAFFSLLVRAAAREGLAPTPPMGFMTWQLFRCNGAGASGPDDDCSDPATTYCISAALIRGQAAAMKARGFVAAGYDIVSQDDCWIAGRNKSTGLLLANEAAWPGGSLAPTADYVHSLGMRFGTYTA